VRRRVFFCSLVMARQLAVELDGAPVDLLVCDTTSVHPKAAPRLQAITRQAANEGLFQANRRLFMQLDGSEQQGGGEQPGRAASAGAGARSRGGEEGGGEGELCVVSELGASCLDSLESAGGAEEAAARREPAWQGPVVRRLAVPPTPKLAIAAEGPGLLILSAAEAHAALRESAAPSSRLPAPADPPSAPGAHEVELALAVLYIFFISL